MTRDDVRAYYEGFGDREWTRLATAEGSVEFAVNTHAIVAYLPPSARVLDIGGGPGRYSLWLAERGHRVVLADLSLHRRLRRAPGRSGALLRAPRL